MRRYPQSWFNPNQQNQSHGYISTDDTDADSVFMHLNQQHQYHNNNRRRNSFSSNASMSELSTHTRHTHNNNHNYNNYNSSAHNNRNQYPDKGAQTLSSSKHDNQMPSAQLFSEPWVYNVNTAVVASPTASAGKINRNDLY